MTGPEPGTYVLTRSWSEFRIQGDTIDRMSMSDIRFRPFVTGARWETIVIGEQMFGTDGDGHPFCTSPVVLVAHYDNRGNVT